MMAKIRNTGTPPTTDANPITNHPATPAASSDTYTTDHAKPSAGGGGV
jgi:hypothetical protein